MKSLQNYAYKPAFNPLDTNGATTTGTALDLAGLAPASGVACVISTGNVAADITTLKIQESANDSSYADVTGATFTAPTGASGDNKTYVCFLRTGGARKRYLRLTVTGGAAATLLSAVWIVNPGQMPNTETERGTAETLFPAV